MLDIKLATVKLKFINPIKLILKTNIDNKIINSNLQMKTILQTKIIDNL